MNLVPDGRMYIASLDFQLLKNGGSKSIMISVPQNKDVYLNTAMNNSAWVSLRESLYEGSDRHGIGSVTLYDKDRDNPCTAETSVFDTVDGGTTDGIEIRNQIIITSAPGFLNPVGMESVIRLRKNTKYTLIAKNNDDTYDTQVSYLLHFIEV